MLNNDEFLKVCNGFEPAALTRFKRSWYVGKVQPVGQGFGNAPEEAFKVKDLRSQMREAVEIKRP